MPSAYEYKERAEENATSHSNTVKVIEAQWQEATSYIDNSLPCRSARKQRARTVHCPCGLSRAIELLYRCFHCGVWYCEDCAKLHFGQPTH